MVGRKKQQNPTMEEEEEEEEEGEGRMGAGSSPHFFKVFFPHHSSHRLKIPPAFKQHLENESLGMVSLRGPSGNIWHVELVSDSEGFCFVRGWKEFVDDHSVKGGDFLVFRYDRCSQFSVLVFDSTACEKKSAFFAQPCQGVVVKEENEEEEEEIIAAGTSKALVLPLGESLGTTAKRVRGVDDHLMANVPPLKKGCNSLEKAAEKGPRAFLGSSKVTKSSSLHGIRAAARLASTTDSLNKKLVSFHENISSDKSMKSLSLQLRKSNYVPRRGKTVAKVQRMAALISERRPITEDEKYKTLQRAMSFKSENPFALQIMKDSYVYVGFFMNIPCEFVREYLPKISRKITLWDPHEKPWKVNYVYYSDRSVGAFSGGWGAFAFGNNLEKYDVCVFELVRKNHIKVHIYRVVPEITPLVRSSSRK